ncbi:hypothetical protein [Paenibacillus oceani]|uniref:Uncharacterized protein n=1 Tax=Paenibacillus oceani TaxID=2772510 RepID=A0A927CCQ4_9BACL|nr:hypothetical protein [Paenibacillus oceani]MBD2864187.1 hypothetical protein [Paenibacillus oceani]
MLKEDAYCICKLYMNRPVQLQTRDGHTHHGTIVHVDSEHVHLQLSGDANGQARNFYPPYGSYGYGYGAQNQIMTLALFDLLAITLLLL